jgi:hypothetical protein
LDDINGRAYNGSGTLIQLMNDWSANPLNSVSINHVTGFTDPQGHLLSLHNLSRSPTMWGLTFTNNLVVAGAYPVWSAGGGPANCAFSDVPVIAVPACFSSYSFSSNGIISSPAAFPPSKWPAQNYFPADVNSVQFVNFNHGNGGDYHLMPSSPYKNAASDGKDFGADIDTLNTAISAVD